MTGISETLASKLNTKSRELAASDFQDLRLIYQTDKKSWIRLLNFIFGTIKKKEDIDFFIYFLDHFQKEIIEVAPFTAAQLNRIFFMLLKLNHYQQVANQSVLLEHCANIKLLEEINGIIRENGFDKFISTMDIYKLKRLVYQLTQKYEKNDIAYQLRIELENPDLEWRDHIEK